MQQTLGYDDTIGTSTIIPNAKPDFVVGPTLGFDETNETNVTMGFDDTTMTNDTKVQKPEAAA